MADQLVMLDEIHLYLIVGGHPYLQCFSGSRAVASCHIVHLLRNCAHHHVLLAGDHLHHLRGDSKSQLDVAAPSGVLLPPPKRSQYGIVEACFP